jgi:lysophospholipase L1-like esterase
MNTARDTAIAVLRCRRALAERRPDLRIVLHAILPADPWDWDVPSRIREINAHLAVKVPALDLWDTFYGPNGLRSELYAPDRIHLSRRGYAAWGRALSAAMDAHET